MCGIAGVCGDGDVEQMLDRLEHRGPDGRAVKNFGDCVFGHVRLAIQDTDSRADQPMTVDGTTVIYNGEAWNTQALRDEFPGREWSTTSDTEPIAALIARDGIEALNKIDGMFAIAWHNEQGVHVCRDRYGKIPVYIGRTPTGWMFASEIKAFPRGMKVQAIKPGTVVSLPSGAVTSWVRDIEPDVCDPENVLTLLRQGVQQRLLSDRPVCFLLSGGLDSSLVLGLARELYDDPVAYTAVYDPESADLKAARRIASELDVRLVEVRVPEPTPESIHEAVVTVENPMKAQVEIALVHMPLMKAIASDGYRVTLSGEAADELFCGYGNMQIAASKLTTDQEYQALLRKTIDKMSRGNFTRVNKVMMSAGVEGRLPFMEERLVATALNAPKHMNRPGKKVLKEAARGVLPKWLINRSKETFQGGTGIAKAAAEISPSPIRYYNAEAVSAFGWLPKE